MTEEPEKAQTTRILLRSTNILLGIIAAVAIGWIVHLGQTVLIPLVIAILFTIILVPFYQWLKRHYIPGPAAFIITVLFFDLVALGLGYLLYLNIHAFVANAAEYQGSIDAVLNSATEWAAGYDLDLTVLRLEDVLGSSTVLGFARASAAGVAKFFTSAVLVLLFQIFIMFEATSLREKIRKNFSSRKTIIQSYDAISSQLRKYFVTKTLISLATGALAALILWILGVDYPLLWGLLTFMLNYIPNVGSFIATLLAAAMALVQHGFGWAILVFAVLTGMEFVMGSLLETRIMGKSLNLSPLVILLSLVVWALLWGPIGAVLAVPMMVFVKAVFDNIDSLKPFARLMESIPRSAVMGQEQS